LKIKAVIFDLDNTLFDFMKMKKEATRVAARAMIKAGLIANRAELTKKLFDHYLDYGIDSSDAFQKYLLSTYKKIDYRILAAAINAYLREKALHLIPYPGVAETLKSLKKQGLKLAIVSDGHRLKVWMRLSAAGLDRYFDTVVTYDDTGKKKPAREPFLKALSLLRVKPSECLMVGDWPERDIVGAKACGITTCWAKYGSRLSEGHEDFVLHEIKDIFKVIKTLN
jgi:HAD superfamily hydrolase (TIGR02253 family)